VRQDQVSPVTKQMSATELGDATPVEGHEVQPDLPQEDVGARTQAAVGDGDGRGGDHRHHAAVGAGAAAEGVVEGARGCEARGAEGDGRMSLTTLILLILLVVIVVVLLNGRL
jgi:hypothetical protein